jgi:hypothetical protein
MLKKKLIKDVKNMNINLIQESIDNLKISESQIDESDLESCRKTLHILIPEMISVLNAVKRLSKGGFR